MSEYLICVLLFFCYQANAQMSCQKIFTPPKGELALDDYYLWDNWTLFDSTSSQYFRYALSAPRSVGPSDSRHLNARIRIFTSKDKSEWREHGPAFRDRLTWSGHTVILNSQFHLFFTEPSPIENQVLQKLMVAKSTDGIVFDQPKTVLDPTSEALRSQAEKLGYHLGSDDGLVMSWRDPFYYEGSLYFAAKAIDPSTNLVRPVIGRATQAGSANDNWILQTPVFLPIEADITQIELPNLRKLKDGRTILSVNLSDRKSDQTPETEVRTWVRLYELGDDHLWQPARLSPLDGQGNLFAPSDNVYGFNFITGTIGLQGSGFFSEGHETNPFSITPFVQLY